METILELQAGFSLHEYEKNKDMTIKEAIKARIDRFNRLWMAAEGHSFEDDPQVKEENYDKVYPDWEKERDKRLAELGYKNEVDYLSWCEDDEEGDTELDEILKRRPIYETSLYYYEMTVIDEAEKIAEFIESLGGDPKERWEEIIKDASYFYEIGKNLEKAGYKIDDGHSANSASCAISFANCLIMNRELFPYLHGAMATLVGDAGYHDDRSDLPKR